MKASCDQSAANRPSNAQPITRIDDHGVGAVFLQTQITGTMLVLAQEYTRVGRGGTPFTTLRLPFGSGATGEGVRATLNRTVLEEAAANAADFDFETLSAAPLYWQVVTSDKSGDRTHLKVVFPARIGRGATRDCRRITDAGTEREEELGPLQWFDIEQLLPRMMNEASPIVHRLGVVSALFWASRQSATVARYYQKQRRYYARALASFEPFHPVVDEYLGRE